MVSRAFLKGHPRAGQPTLFVEKIMAGLADIDPDFGIPPDLTLYDFHEYYNCREPKFHTIRKGNRFKPGDTASLRIWSGLPYRSKQIEIATVEIKKTWSFEMDENGVMSIDGMYVLRDEECEELASHDGLSAEDFFYWFMPDMKHPKIFTGQIICWNESIVYDIKPF